MLIRHFRTTTGQKQTAPSRGDTLIEVMFAVAVFGMIVVSSLALMNQGSATSRRAVEITMVRQQIDAQAETLRFLQSAYVNVYYSGIAFTLGDTESTPAEEYYRIIQRIDVANPHASAFGSTPCDNPPTNSFVMNTRTAQVQTDHSLFKMPIANAQVVYDGANVMTASNGIWVEGVRSTDTGNAGYIDFHIRGCWPAPGMSTPMNLGTIVRLYEPRG